MLIVLEHERSFLSLNNFKLFPFGVCSQKTCLYYPIITTYYAKHYAGIMASCLISYKLCMQSSHFSGAFSLAHCKSPNLAKSAGTISVLPSVSQSVSQTQSAEISIDIFILTSLFGYKSKGTTLTTAVSKTSGTLVAALSTERRGFCLVNYHTLPQYFGIESINKTSTGVNSSKNV